MAWLACVGVRYRFPAKAWRHAPGSWVFLTVPDGPGREMRELFGGGPGWGSIRVEATIGGTAWKTSLFPDKAAGSYVLPLKAEVRKVQGIEPGDTVQVELRVIA